MKRFEKNPFTEYSNESRNKQGLTKLLNLQFQIRVKLVKLMKYHTFLDYEEGVEHCDMKGHNIYREEEFLEN